MIITFTSAISECYVSIITSIVIKFCRYTMITSWGRAVWLLGSACLNEPECLHKIRFYMIEFHIHCTMIWNVIILASSPQLSDAPKGKLTLQDKFRRLQSCQYLRVYQPRRGSSADADKVTSWDTAEKSLRTGFGAFAMKK